MPKTSDNTELTPQKRTRTQTRNRSKASSSNPPPPIPPPIPPTQNLPPPYRRFTSAEAEERFEAIREVDFVAERGFDLRKLTGHPTFERTLIEKGLLNLNAMVGQTSNKTIALEFFANAVSEKKGSYQTYVRGKLIDFGPTAINRVLGLPVPQVCDVERRRKPQNWPRSNEEWDALVAGFMKEGKGWKRKHPTYNPQRIDTADLLPVPRSWASFILATIVSTSAAAEMITSRVFILLVLLSEHEQMNAGVLPEAGDLFLRSQLPVTDSTMKRLEKKLEEGGGAHHEPNEPQQQQQHQHQAPPPAHPEEYPPMHPALAEYIYTSANWMDEASSQLYIEPPRFSQQFSQMALNYQRPPTGSFNRFGSRDNMRSYFQTNRDRAERREHEIEQNYDYEEDMEMATALAGNQELGGGSHYDQQYHPGE